MNKRLLCGLAVLLTAVGVMNSAHAVPPTAPSNLLAVPVYTDDDMRLTWSDNAGDEDGFRIERRTDTSAFAPLDSVGANVETYTDTTAVADIEYFYQVRAYNVDGDSANSNEATNRIAVEWTLANGNHEMMNGWQDGTTSNIWGFHEGIDIQDDGSGGQVVVAARGGLIHRSDPDYAGGHFAVEIRDGADDFFDRYLHVTITTAKVEGETVSPGEAVATISTTAYVDGRRHVHQAVVDHWVEPSGYASDGSNFSNTFTIFDVAADQDPLGNTPSLEDVDGDGFNLLYKRPDDSYITDGIVWGDVDISAEMTDNMGSSPRQNPQRVGFWIDATLPGASDVRNAGTPYILHDFSEWFGQSGSKANYHVIYDPGKSSGSKRYNHLLTNTTGTDGAVANLDGGQVWRTDAQAGSGVEPNGSDAGQARENQEATFPDGTYFVHVLMEDLLHAANNVRSVLIDNSRPYIKRVTVYSGASIVYQAQWVWDAAGGQLEIQPADFASAAAFAALRTQDITIEVEFSEPMETASITAVTPDTGVTGLGVIPTLASTQSAHARTIWRGLISNLDIADDGSHDGTHILSIDGTDLAGNALLEINGRGSMGPDHHNRDGTGAMRGTSGLDTIHGFRIGPLVGAIPITAIFMKQTAVDPVAPTVADKALAIQTALNDYYDEVSYGEISFAVTGHGWYRLAHSLGWYETTPHTPLIDLVEEAIAAAEADGVAVHESDYVLVVTDEDVVRTEWSTNGAWPYSVTPAPGWKLMAGGTMNLASTNPHITNLAGRMVGLIDLFAYPEVTVLRPFVGPWSHMSDKDNNIHMLGWEKWRVGWLDETGTATGKTLTRVTKPAVATPIVDSDYTISATDADTDTLKLVAIEIGDRLYYTAEYRRQNNLDTDLPDAGVVISKANEHINQGEGPVIVQESDVSAGNLDDAPFTTDAPRNIFDDLGSGVNIEVTSMDANEAQIRLNYALPPTENDVYVSDIDERWKSEDIWVDAPDVGGEYETDPLAIIDDEEQPEVGERNIVYGRVRNQGHADATNFEVHLEIREPWGAGGPWRALKIENVALLQGTDTDDTDYHLIHADWYPVGDIHSCVRLSVTGVANDVNVANNWTQENISQFTTTSGSPFDPVTTRFEVENPYDETITVAFKLDGLPSSWSYIVTPERLTIPANGVGSAQVTLQPHEAAPLCSHEVITVSAYTPRVDTLKELGAVTLQVGLKNPASITAQSQLVCGQVDPKAAGELTHRASFAQECVIHTQGCTDPVLPNTQVAVVYTSPDGTTLVHYVTTDEHGCYVDTLGVGEPGPWGTEVVLEEDDCREGATAPSDTVDVPPIICGGPLWCCWLLLALAVAVIATLLWLARLLCGNKSSTLPFLIALLVTIVLTWVILTRCDVMLCWLLLVIVAAILLAGLTICFTRYAPCIGRGRESTHG